MTAMILLFDPEQEALVREKILPRLEGHAVEAVACAGRLPDAAGPETILLTYLSDAALKPLLPEAMSRDCRLALLPHPGMKHARIGFGVASRWEDALEDILAAEDAIEVDLLHCNGQPVFNSVVIGDPFTLMPGTAATEGLWARLRRFARLIASLGKVMPQSYKLSTHKEKTLETAALGIVAVEHGRSSVMARRILGDSAVNDGMLHALVLAPRSVLEMARFLARSLVLRGIGRDGRLPAFIGHIRTEALHIETPRPVGYGIDGEPDSAEAIELSVAPRALRLIPGRNLQVDNGAPEAKEGFRVQGLPAGEAV
ncbi:MAG: diacylglycerol/lipid kinase family protein, partial [Gammaproteobacteria bacterium]